MNVRVVGAIWDISPPGFNQALIHGLRPPWRDDMITVEQWDNGTVYLTDERFEPLFRLAFYYGIPFQETFAYEGAETGTLLHPDFGDILE